MSTVKIHCKTITPMFMAGADGKTFELRPPSIKGAMRFWWRAYHWGRNAGKLKPEDIEKEEGKIFGTTSNSGRKSCFSIHMGKQVFTPSKQRFLRKSHHLITVIIRGKPRQMDILDYLVYGTYDFKKKDVFSREYLPANHPFTISLNIFQEAVNINGKIINIEDEIIKSFYFLSVFGGLGPKSRNGFGSFTVMKTEPGDIFTKSKLNYPFIDQNFIMAFTKNSEIPPFSAFSKKIKIFKLKQFEQPYQTWDDCLAELGKIYREARGSLESKHHCEKRQYIGAPMTIDGKQSFLERHAKPYFIRVVKSENGFDGYILYLPSLYCEGLDRDRYNNRIPKDVNITFQAVCDEFNRALKATGKIEPYYGPLDQKSEHDGKKRT